MALMLMLGCCVTCSRFRAFAAAAAAAKAAAARGDDASKQEAAAKVAYEQAFNSGDSECIIW